MVDKVSDYHVPPFSPGADPEGLHIQGNKSQNVGDKLYEHSSSFYSWYQWFRPNNESGQGTHNLQVIMQIAKTASLYPEEEQDAIERLSNLRDDLDSGRVSLSQIGYETERIIDNLIENNPKNRVVMYTTQIEMAINHSEGKPSSELKEALGHIMDKVSEMAPIQAETLSRNLSLVLSPDNTSKDILNAFHQTVLPLLDKS